jgi:hypothetical protein
MRRSLAEPTGLVWACLVVGGALAVLPAATAIDFGMVRVQQNSNANTSAAVTLTAWANSPQFQVAPTINSNRGDFGIQIGPSRADDVTGGIFLASVANNGRDNGETGSYLGIRYGEASMDSDASGWFVPMHDAASGGEYNFDFSAVYFPFAEGWVVGHARNAVGTNGGVYDQIRTGTGPSAVALGGSSGNRLVAPGTTSAPDSTLANGRSDLYLQGVNTLTDGLLFVNHGKNEANIATARPAPAGTHFELQVQDYDSGAEHDPVAFAYVPYGTPGVTMGRIASHTTTVSTTTYYGARATTSQGDFSIQRVASGAYQLKIPGKTTADGTLLVSAAGFESVNTDNIVTFAPLADGTGWQIETRDLPLSTTATTGIAGQDIPSGQAIFDFLFVPTANPPTAPGSQAGYRGNRVAAANYFVTEFAAGNEASDMTVNASVGTSGLGTSSSNRGDNKPGVGGAAIPFNTTAASADVVLTSTSQGFRDNPLGADGYGLATVWNDGGTYCVATANNANAEINVNFAVAHFPATAGFVQAPAAPTSAGQATLPLDPAAGLLLATPAVNSGALASVDISTPGSQRVNVVGFSGTMTSTTPFGYVFLPNDTPGLVSGRVDGATGSITTGAATGSYTLTRTATGVYTLSLAGGRSPDTGMLLLNALAAGGEFDNFAVWEKSGTDFTIRVLDAATSPTAVDGDFQFAYVSYDQSLSKSSDLAATASSIDFGKALVGTTVTAPVGATATSPHSYTVTSFRASGSAGSAALAMTTAAGTIRGDTANVAAAGSVNISAVASASGPLTATISLTNLTDTSDTTGLDISAALAAYEPASLSQGQSAAVASGGFVSLANAAATGSLRAEAEIVARSFNGDTGWSVTGFQVGSTIAAAGVESGTATFDATGRLNGTYTGTFAVAVEHADLSIVGTSAGDLGQFTWSLSHEVGGRVAESGHAVRRGGDPYHGLGLARGQGRATAAAILAGQAGSHRTVQFDFRDAASAPVLSDILELTGTGGDPIVLSVSYDESLLGGMTESSLRLGWLDENVSSATFNQWVAAIDGNTANPVFLQAPFAGSWDSYWAAFTSANPTATLADARGASGVDAVSNTAWAVIDHNSSFAVVPVPEPGVTVLAGLGLGGLGAAFRRRCRS